MEALKKALGSGIKEKVIIKKADKAYEKARITQNT